MPGQARGTPLYWIEDRALRALISGARALPYVTRVRAMGHLLSSVIGPLAGYRRRARAHLAHVFPDLTDAERRVIADAALDNAGRTLIENYSGPDLMQQLDGVSPRGAGLPFIEAARADGRPVIFVTGHFGNYEAPRRVLTGLGFRIGGLYKPMANPFFNAHYARTMAGVSGPVFPRGPEGTRGFVRHLRAGGMATLLFDVYDAAGAEFDFLGRPALTALSAAELALRYDALLVPYFGIRGEDGLSFTVEIDAPIAPSDPSSMMRAASAALEARIHRHPGQWFWVHRRWKPFFRP